MTILLILLVSVLFQTSNSYVAINQPTNWTDAENYCIETYGSHLASIHSLSENSEIYAMIDVSSWIGLNDIDVEGTWIWTDGSTNAFTKWFTNEPNGGDAANCAMIYAGTTSIDKWWNDRSCSSMEQFVCNDPISTTLLPTTSTESVSSTTCGITQTSLSGYAGLSKVSCLYELSQNEWRGPMFNMTMGDGNTYDSFIVIHPLITSTGNCRKGYGFVEWRLNGEYAELSGVIGYSANSPEMNVNKIQMRVYVDGALKHESRIFTTVTQFEYININVSGANVLQIGVDALGNMNYDHAVIANPMLLSCSASQSSENITSYLNNNLCVLYEDIPISTESILLQLNTKQIKNITNNNDSSPCILSTDNVSTRSDELFANMSVGYVSMILLLSLLLICFVCGVVFFYRKQRNKGRERDDVEKGENEIQEIEMNEDIFTQEGVNTVKEGRKIIVHAQHNELEFALQHELNELNEAVFLNLTSTIKTHFNLQNDAVFSLNEKEDGKNLSVEDINDVIDAFEASQHANNLVLHLHVEMLESKDIQIQIDHRFNT